MMISRSIVEAVRNKPGRFLEKDPVSKLWMDIGDKKAIEKTSQALRDGAASLRKQLSEDLSDPDFLNAVFSSEPELNESQTDSQKNKSENKTKNKIIKPNVADDSEITQQHKRIKSEESVASSTLPSSYASSLNSSIDMDYEVNHNSKSTNSSNNNNPPRPPLPSKSSSTKRHIRHHSLKTPCPVTSKAIVTPPPAASLTPVTSSSAPVSPHPQPPPIDSYQPPPYSNPHKRNHVRRHTTDVLPDQLYNNYSHHYPPSPTPSYSNPDGKFVTPYHSRNSPPLIQRCHSNPTTSYNRHTPPPPSPNYYSPTMPYHERKKYYSEESTSETFDHRNRHPSPYHFSRDNYGAENYNGDYYNGDNRHQHYHHRPPPPTLPFRGTPHSVRDFNYPHRTEANRMMKEDYEVDNYEDLEMITPLPFQCDEDSQEPPMSISTMIDLQNRL